ncbi:hypothetical protein QJS04_geneDACA014200 [Acorus gramineus]|uniref:peptidylprolyl isomerase n=1 Tax=Acorus gramineus TaxID=55184 RepID=A0AAV9B6M9_ACOGR|nr:hypothetical protein QJS04_geneDACA014200 [Acorus gramineus]
MVSSCAAASSSLLLPFGSRIAKRASSIHHVLVRNNTQASEVQCSVSCSGSKSASTERFENRLALTSRRHAISVILALSGFGFALADAKGAGLPPEEKPKLCDAECEKELENVPMVTTESGLQYKDIQIGRGPSPPIGFQVAANYVAMVSNGQIFDSSLEKGIPYLFRVGSGQVIKGLDEGILSMKAGGKRRLYIPGSLAFPKGLTSAPGRPRVAPNSPVIFDVSLEYIPGLELDEE